MTTPELIRSQAARARAGRGPPRARRLCRHHRAAVLPRVPHAARRAPRAVRALLARGALHPRAAVRCAGHPAAVRHGRAHGLRGCLPLPFDTASARFAGAAGKAAGLRPGAGRGALLRRDAHAGASVQVRRPARCAGPVRALAGRGRARAAGRGRCGGAGAADALAPAVAPVQPGRHPGPGAFAPNRLGPGPASPASDAVYQDARWA